MTIDEKIRDEKRQYDTNREAVKISALSSGKNDKHEYLTVEEILPPDQRRVIERANFSYFSLDKAFGKQIKTIEEKNKWQRVLMIQKSLQVLKFDYVFIKI